MSWYSLLICIGNQNSPDSHASLISSFELLNVCPLSTTIIDSNTITEPCPVCPSRNQHGDCNFIEKFLPLLVKDVAMQEQYSHLVKVVHSTIVYKMYTS